MLDARHLNELINQYSKLKQVVHKDKLTIDKNHIVKVQRVLQLCLLTSDVTPNNKEYLYNKNEQYFDEIKPFIEDTLDVSQYPDIFVQSDKETPIIHASIEQARKYATYDVLKQIFRQKLDFQITSDDINNWKNYKDIEALSKQRQKFI